MEADTSDAVVRTGPRADVAALERLTQVLVGVTVQSLDALGGAITVAQVRLLRILDALGRVPSSALAAALGSDPSSVTRLVDQLEAAGFVARGADPRSRTIVTLEVTPTGHDALIAVLGRRRVLLEAVLDAMAPAECELIAEVAERFVLRAGGAAAAGARGPAAP